MGIPYDPEIPILGINPTEIQVQITKRLIFIVLLFILTPNTVQSKNSLSIEWMNKLWYIQTSE